MPSFFGFFRAAVLCAFVVTLLGCQTQGGLHNAQGDTIKLTFPSIAKGDARLTCRSRCLEAWDLARNYARQLYADKSWVELALLVGQTGFNSDQSYFYLGRSVEELGYPQAARTYYRLAQEAKIKCSESAKQCDGFDIANELKTRPLVLDAFSHRSAMLMRCMDRTASYQYVQRTLASIPDYGVNELDPSGLSVLISASVNGRFKLNMPAKDVALAVVSQTSGASHATFLVVKKVVENVGYAVEWDRWSNRKLSAVLPHAMAITLDEQKSFVLISEINQEQAHLLYANGQVCVVPVSYFLNGPDDNVFLEIVAPAQKSSRVN